MANAEAQRAHSQAQELPSFSEHLTGDKTSAVFHDLTSDMFDRPLYSGLELSETQKEMPSTVPIETESAEADSATELEKALISDDPESNSDFTPQQGSLESSDEAPKIYAVASSMDHDTKSRPEAENGVDEVSCLIDCMPIIQGALNDWDILENFDFDLFVEGSPASFNVLLDSQTPLPPISLGPPKPFGRIEVGSTSRGGPASSPPLPEPAQNKHDIYRHSPQSAFDERVKLEMERQARETPNNAIIPSEIMTKRAALAAYQHSLLLLDCRSRKRKVMYRVSEGQEAVPDQSGGMNNMTEAQHFPEQLPALPNQLPVPTSDVPSHQSMPAEERPAIVYHKHPDGIMKRRRVRAKM